MRVMRWKCLVFFSPWVIHLTLHFWNQWISPSESILLKWVTKSFSRIWSFWEKLFSWDFWTPSILDGTHLFSRKMLPKAFLFQEVAALVKLLRQSIRLLPNQELLTISRKEGFNSHAASSLNGLLIKLILCKPNTLMIKEEWSEWVLGKLRTIPSRKRALQFALHKALLSLFLVLAKPCLPLVQVNFGPELSMFIRLQLLILSMNFLLQPLLVSGEELLISVELSVLLKSPATNHGVSIVSAFVINSSHNASLALGLG